MIDVLVIGAGLGGLCAALAAAEAGLSVRVIAKGMGALHWSAGTVDVLGYMNGSPFAVDDPFGALAGLPEDHPYRVVGAERALQSVQHFQQWMQAAGLPYAGAGTRNTLLPSAVGAVRPVYLAPEAQAAGTMPRDEPMLIVGIDPFRDFYPLMIAENLNKQGVAARAAYVPWEAVSELRDRNPVQLATGLEEPTQLATLARALKPLLRAGERIGFPAILGLDGHATVMQTLQEATGATLFEIPIMPPSVPGIRLFRALARLLQARGVRVEMNMEAVGFYAEDGHVRWVESATSARPLKHYAKQFVLATGGVLGGGFQSGMSGAFWESVFRLPLSVPTDRSQWFNPNFFAQGGQPVFHGGVRVDSSLRALDADGNVVYQNLRVAGNMLAGSDAIVEHSAEGIAIATGIAAGIGIAAQEMVGTP